MQHNAKLLGGIFFMPENYDDLISEMGQYETVAGNSPQGGQLSKEEFAAKMKAERDRLSELANTTVPRWRHHHDSVAPYCRPKTTGNLYSHLETDDLLNASRLMDASDSISPP
jgi:hypothetical protein